LEGRKGVTGVLRDTGADTVSERGGRPGGGQVPPGPPGTGGPV